MRKLNDNEAFSKKKLNDNDNDAPFVVGHSPRERKAYNVARKLVEKFRNPKGLRFYYSVALNLSESEIWQYYERAHKPGIGNPGGYFVRSCNNALSALPK